KETGGQVEIFCLEPSDHIDPQIAMSAKNQTRWKCLVGGAKKWKEGPVTIITDTITIKAFNLGRLDDTFEIGFEWEGDFTFSEILSEVGELPLPPYMNRKAEEADEDRYQTVYAKNEGSVAAPTAGLHFTNDIIENLKTKGVYSAFVTLHVGAGTFKPVKTDTIEEHVMHFELIDVSMASIKEILHSLGPIIPVGTTSLRTLESLYWFGVKAHMNQLDVAHPELTQWEPYQDLPNLTLKESIKALLAHMRENEMTRFMARTQLIIAPGYKFKVAKGLITNFHQPKSTLLLIIAAMIGDNWKKMYDHALKYDYRFLSYGDCCFLIP
ncbi:MAG: S-adenosylmethionine:tRNA ribosyltransferase-isomerase, partial [Flavobacteriales bacterium]|nr:S-adenosylmethionine:tRNA ribosyltransferase-isomerase [Flavobacteriales bacterium]